MYTVLYGIIYFLRTKYFPTFLPFIWLWPPLRALRSPTHKTLGVKTLHLPKRPYHAQHKAAAAPEENIIKKS